MKAAELTQAVLGVLCAMLLLGQSQMPHIAPSAGVPETERTLKLSRPSRLEFVPPGPPLQQPEIPQAFFGCWEGGPKSFDGVLSDPGTKSSSALQRVVFCYGPHEIRVPEIEMSLTPRQSVLDLILGHLGLGYIHTRPVDAKTEVYEITASQIHARTTVTFEVTESWIYKLPSTHEQLVTDEELVTFINPTRVFVSGLQFLTVSGRRSVGSWNAYFHRW